ncbi:MAG: hypothetical protein AAFR58_11725 [Cyanobacteria bacterium J06627_28]
MVSGPYFYAQSLASGALSANALGRQPVPLAKQSDVDSAVSDLGDRSSFFASGVQKETNCANGDGGASNGLASVGQAEKAFADDEKFELLSAFLDDEVTEEERQLVLHWLQSDEAVKADYQKQMRLREALRSLKSDLL